MEDIAYAAKVICIASLCAALFNIFSPDGAMKKSFKYALGIFVLFAVITPVKDIDIDLSSVFESASYEDLSDEYSSALDEVTKTEFELKIASMADEKLKAKGISNADIKIVTDIDSDNCIYIKKAQIYISKKYSDNIYGLKADIENYLGIKTDIFIKP